jgi:hypothetical protein
MDLIFYLVSHLVQEMENSQLKYHRVSVASYHSKKIKVKIHK